MNLTFKKKKKKEKCYFSYEKRKQLLEAIRYVDLVIPEESWGQKITDIKEYQILDKELIAFGGVILIRTEKIRTLSEEVV